MKIAIIAGEASGDSLGAGLMQALKGTEFIGIGGAKMQKAGLDSFFPMDELTVMGFAEVIANLPRLLKRIKQTADFIISENPSVAVFIDAQDFCDRVAKIVRAKAPHIKLVKYVAPTVWAWRPKRAQKLRPIYDEVLALFPFEPDVMKRLSGPPTTYIGHPLIREIAQNNTTDKPYALVLPGSRGREIKYLLPVFGETIANFPHFTWILPTLDRLKPRIEAEMRDWTVKPLIVTQNKQEYFKKAHIALAASGTVTLELALYGVPMIAAYKGGAIEAVILRKLVKTPSILLPNLILNYFKFSISANKQARHAELISASQQTKPLKQVQGDERGLGAYIQNGKTQNINIVPEFLQNDVTSDILTKALKDINTDAQHISFKRLREIMEIKGSPDENAARIVSRFANQVNPAR